MGDVGYKLQVNFKTPRGALVNVTGDSAEDLAVQLTAFSGLIPMVASIEASLIAAATVGEGIPLAPADQQPVPAPAPPAPADPWSQTPQSAPLPPLPGHQQAVGAPTPAPSPPFPGASGAPSFPPQQQQQAPQQQYAQPQAGQLLCKHGVPAKVVPGGISQKTGRPYKSFAVCSYDRDFQCDFRQTL